MEKGYYSNTATSIEPAAAVAIHNKNGKGLLLFAKMEGFFNICRNPQ